MIRRSPFRHFKTSLEIIRLAVMLYVRFPLSLRNVEELLHERGVEVSHETVRFWWNRFGPMFASEIRRNRISRMRACSNAEFTLSAAIALNGQIGVHVLACDTDGVDGAAEVAGAYAGPETLALAHQRGIDPPNALKANDAHSFFERAGGQIITGPTLTNVNDFRAVLVMPPD